MPDFEVSYIVRTGHEEKCVIHAPSAIDAARQVVISGQIPCAVGVRRDPWLGKLKCIVRATPRTSLADLALFAEQFSGLLKASVTAEQALELLAREADRAPVAALAARLMANIRAGCALSQALEGEPGIPGYFTGLVRGSERGGNLAQGLGYLGEYLARQAGVRGKLVATLTYPAIVVATAIFALVFVLVVVIPEFTPLFAGEEANLPMLTRLVVLLSTLVTTRLPELLIGAACLVAGGWLAIDKLPRLKPRLTHAFGHWAPLRLAIWLDVAKTLHVLGALLTSGADAAEALVLATDAATSSRLKQGLRDSGRLVREGGSVSAALREIALMPASAIALIAMGERGGALGAATTRAALLLELEANRRIDRWIALINPIAVMVLGVMIAVLISAVMMGILSANRLVLR